MFNAIGVFFYRRRKKKDKFEIISPQRLNEVLSQITPSDLQLNKSLGHTNGDLVNSNLDLAKNQGLNNNQTVDQEIAAVQGQEQVQDLNQNTLATSIGEKKVARVQVNALSLSSIRKKRELENSLEKRVVDLQDLPKEHFTLESLMQLWNQYAERLSQNGMMLMASLMGMTRPVLNGSIINLELPNQGSKISFDENKYDLVNFLRKKLNNYDIEIHIVVNEQIKVVSKVMNSKDKYQHFTQLNPQIENLRQVFDLELK